MPRPPNASKQLASLSLADLHQELARRLKRHPALERRRAKLMKELAAIDAELGDFPAPADRRRGRPAKATRAAKAGRRGRAGRPRGPRTGNTATLTEALSAVLKDKTMGVAEAAEAAKAAGYKSNAANFKLMVNVALLKGPLKKVARGKYTAT